MMEEKIQKKIAELEESIEKHCWQKGGLSDFDVEILKSFLQTALQEIYTEGQLNGVEHCDEPSCPECNLVAYNRGRSDTIEECLKCLPEERKHNHMKLCNIDSFTCEALQEENKIYNTARQEIITRINQLRK